MPDVLNLEQRRACMAAVKSGNTKPEMSVRRLVHAMGYRYALHKRTLPGRPDLCFVSRRKVIFVHGCFWHGHTCRRGARVPIANREYWIRKIRRNRERDLQSRQSLSAMGWKSLIVWECELKSVSELARTIGKFLERADVRSGRPVRSRARKTVRNHRQR